jgi:hypothetical protein
MGPRGARSWLSTVLTSCVLTWSVAALGVGTRLLSSQIQVRLLAREQPIARTSFGYNSEYYIAEMQHKSGERKLSRLSYRFLYYEAPMPAAFLDYSYVYRFRALRDDQCDTTLAAVTQKYAVRADGQIDIEDIALTYASGAPPDQRRWQDGFAMLRG